jgi:hypothetical protein
MVHCTARVSLITTLKLCMCDYIQMNMSALTPLRVLINAMTSSERKVAKKFLSALKAHGESSPKQALMLWDLLAREIKDKRILEDRQIENLIYNKKSTAFPRLILRVKEKVGESLLLNVNVTKPKAFSDRAKAMYLNRKKLMLAQNLYGRGIWDWVLSLLSDCIEEARKYEHYTILLDALSIRMELTSVDKGENSYEADSELFNKTMHSIAAVKKAIHFFNILTSQTEFKAGPINFNELEANVKELQKDFELTGSATVAQYLHYLEAHFFQEKKYFKKASDILKAQVELVEIHPALYSPTRLAAALVNMALNEIYTRRFASALRYTERAANVAKLIPKKHFNLLQCVEVNFHANFYSGKFERALENINYLCSQELGSAALFRKGKWEYQKACILFMLKDFEQVNKVLIDLNPIEDDLEGWNLALRTLHIMCDIEQEKTEEAFYKIENLRKILDKLKKNTSWNNPREVFKYDLLKTLANSGFNFVETRTRKLEELNKLKENRNGFEWRILSPELVIFDQWFLSKVFKQSLVLKIPSHIEHVIISEK